MPENTFGLRGHTIEWRRDGGSGAEAWVKGEQGWRERGARGEGKREDGVGKKAANGEGWVMLRRGSEGKRIRMVRKLVELGMI